MGVNEKPYGGGEVEVKKREKKVEMKERKKKLK